MGPPAATRRVRFDRNELSGAFGDLGTDFPLVVGMVLAAGLDVTSVLVMFGLMQVLTGLAYGLPMPVQPLKAMAVIVITQKLAPGVLFGGGLAIGVVVLLLAVTGAVDWLATVVPRPVVRGIQLGLGLQLAQLALRDYVPSEGAAGYALAAVAFVLTLFLLGSRRYPPATLVILLGVAYALLVKVDGTSWGGSFGFHLPAPSVPTWPDVATGFLVLAIPQLPLSLANSVLGTRQVLADLFPERRIGVRRISFTYSLMNLVNPFFGGIPTCHGAGGLAGHYAFGARTGGSVVIEGALYAGIGLFLGGGFATVILLFPRPVLGIILLFEALTLLRLTKDVAGSAADFSVALLVGAIALALPYGYAVGLVVGTLVAAAARRGITAFGRGDGGTGRREVPGASLHRYSFAEYLAVEEASNAKHEYLSGEIYGMAGGTPEHAALSVAVSSALHAQLRGGPCRVYSPGLRVRVLATGLATYPDVTVVCGELERDPESPTTIVNPRAVVEVLSDGTEAYDRGQKLEHYRQVPSLAAVVLVSHRGPSIEVWERGAEGAWRRRESGPGEAAEIQALPVRLLIDEIYAGSEP